jgi:ATP synthase protein I
MASTRSLQDLAFKRTRNRLIQIQVGLVSIVFIGSMLLKNNDFALAVLFGGIASIAGTLVSAWRLIIAADEAKQNPTYSVGEFYKSALLRFIVVIALLAIGFGGLKLNGLGILIGFIAAQLGYIFSRPLRARA